MKRIILLSIFQVFTRSFLLSQWENIGTLENDNVYHLFQINEGTTIATGEKASLYNLDSETPLVVASDLYEFGFIMSSLAIDNETAFLGGGCYFTFDECPANTLYRTIDGGDTWSDLESDATFMGTGNTMGILPVNDSSLVIIKEYEKIHRINLISGEAVLVEIPGTEEVNNFSQALVSKGGKWLVEANFYNAGILDRRYYESKDKGQTWEELSIDILEDEPIIKIDYLSNGNLACVTNSGKIYVYNDEQTDAISEISDAYNNITAYDLIDDNNWYIASHDSDSNQSILHRSEDGGVTWSQDKLFSEGFISSLSFKNKNNGFLVLNNRMIYKRSGPNHTISDPKVDLKVSPNPAQNFINIEGIVDPTNYTFSVLDLNGKIVAKSKFVDQKISTSNLSNGMYFLVISDQKRINSSTKFIIVKS